MSELVERVTPHELADWEGFEVVHGPLLVHDRIDAAAARICWAIRGGDSPDEYLPTWDYRPKRTQTPEEMIGVIRGIQRKKDK